MLHVVKIFPSIEGEGPEAGRPTIFVRLAGCSIHCLWCDTREAWKKEDHPTKSVSEIVERVWQLVTEHGIGRCSLTGGNPMESDSIQLAELISKLSSLIKLNIEHPGVFNSMSGEMSSLSLLGEEKGYAHSVTFDIKPLSAKVDFDLDSLMTALYILRSKGIHCIIKAVFADDADLEFIEKCCSLIPWTYKPKWDEVIQGPYLQPCADPSGNIRKISDEMLKKLLGLCTRYGGRLTPQIHKCLNLP